MLGIKAEQLAPTELINAILQGARPSCSTSAASAPM